jgi:hypothetical protein
MRRLQDGEWVDIQPRKKYLVGYPTEGFLPVPEMWGHVLEDDDTTQQWLNCHPRLTIWGYDIREMIHKDSKKPGQIAEIEITGNDLIKTVAVLARNNKAYENNYSSNYTTDPDDHRKGHDPIGSYKMDYGNVNRIEETPIDLVEYEATWRLPRVPRDPGYSLVINLTDRLEDPNPGIAFNIGSIGTKITCNLRTDRGGLKYLMEKSGDDDHDQDSDSDNEGKITHNASDKSNTSTDAYTMVTVVLFHKKVSFQKNHSGKYQVYINVPDVELDKFLPD